MRADSLDPVELVDDTDEQMTGEAVALDLRPTAFVLRAAGALIDFAVEVVLAILVLLGLFWLAAQLRSEDAVYFALTIVSLVLSFVIAPLVVEAASRGKSLGRLAVGARIVRDDGGAIGVRHAAIRAFAGIFEFYSTLGGGAVLFGLLSPRTKRMGDLLAGTYSQYERIARTPPVVFGMPVQLTAWSITADVARLPDRLARRIAQFLDNADRIDPARRAYLARGLAAEAAPFVSPLPTVDPELFLAGVTVVRRGREAQALELARRRLERLEPALASIPHGFPSRG